MKKYKKKIFKGYLERVPPVDWKRLAVRSIPYVLIAYVCNRLSWLYQYCTGQTMFVRLYVLLANIKLAFANLMPSFAPRNLLIGALGGGAIYAIVRYKGMNAKKYRHGMEYGSARWGTRKDIAPFVDPEPDNNVILTATESLTMNNRPAQPKYARNKNVLVIGGSGSGKTRFFVKPNLMQLHSSYVITDPKGMLLIECGNLLAQNEYDIRTLNTIDFTRSMHYNPFAYIHSEKDILKLVNVLIANTKGEGDKSGEDFWVKAERLLFYALFGFLYYEAPPEEQNFSMLLDLINAFEVHEEDEEFKNAVDLLFMDLEKNNPDHFAVRQYAKFKLAAGVLL